MEYTKINFYALTAKHRRQILLAWLLSKWICGFANPKGGLIDSWGRGTVRIIEACKEAGLPDPELTERDSGFPVTLYKDNLTEEQLVILGLNRRQIKAVLYVKEKEEISTSCIERNLVYRKEQQETICLNYSISWYWRESEKLIKQNMWYLSLDCRCSTDVADILPKFENSFTLIW